MWTNILRRNIKLIILFVVLVLASSSSRAQYQSNTLFSSHDVFSPNIEQFNSVAQRRLTGSSTSSNLIPTLGLIPTPLLFPTPLLLVSAGSVQATNSELFPRYSCPPAIQIDLVSTCLFPPSPKFAVADDRLNLHPVGAVRPTAPLTEKFHWGSALGQSFAFLVVGHAFRLANDSGARGLLFHKPFWHDYWASSNNFNMDHWGDGDSFLVNYIGHPMEGAVYGYVFLNNDPKGRAARFGKSTIYWNSRLKAMAWATVWEAYFEIGPIFSEAAIGNEGGYTYVPGCGLYPCNKFPGKSFKPPTNNTGWVDFVITPVVGMGWIVMEDAIEREFVDRLADGSPALKYKILRGSLAPSHTFANLFAGKKPWFRYQPEGTFAQTFGAPLHPPERPASNDEPRYSLGVQFVSTNFTLESESCANCKKFLPGYGFDFAYRFAKYAYFDSVTNLFPGSGSDGRHGGAQEVLAGLKLGSTMRSWGFFVNIRNGFIHYDKALVPGTYSAYQSTWRYALDVGGTVEYYASPHSTFFLNTGTTLIHYLQPYSDPNQPPSNVLSTQYYTFQGSPYLCSGYVYRF
jgi:hypothetical protein